ncbi:MAG: glycosyltransferase [Nitrospinales bacterium]
MKILQIHNRYQYSGGEDAVADSEKRLLEDKGHSVIRYLRHNDEINDSSFVNKIGLFLNATWSWKAYRQIKNILRRERPDVAHFHNTLPLISPGAYYACKEVDIPVVQTLHNYRLLCPSALLYRDGNICEECLKHSLVRSIQYGCYRGSRIQTMTVALMLATHRRLGTWHRKVDAYVVLTNFSRNKFIGHGLPSDKIFIKPNFPKRSSEYSVLDNRYALFLGRISAEKGLLTLLKAWENLKHIKLKIAGDGPFSDKLKDIVQEKMLDNIEFLGHQSDSECRELLKKSSFVVLPSQCCEGGFPLTAIEAFAAGKPLIATNLGAMAEAIVDGQTGLHFSAGDHQELAAKIAWAWSHANAMERMGFAARKKYENKYTAEKNYAILLDIYRRVIAQIKDELSRKW